ncbi:MAG TPA: hypothetical protein VKZ63_20680, partial [Kofleriaceae bacterium]|nr:hypothetical protein [Kofleriaceae bacterium]
ELAAHGAKVLHAEAVEAARRFGVALYARATQGGGEGTRIDRPEGAVRASRVSGVAGQKNLVRLRARGEGAAAELIAVASGERLPVQALVAGGEGADLVVQLDDVPDWPAVRDRARAKVAGLAIEEGLGAASVAGDFVGRDGPLIERARAAAAEAGVTVTGVVTSPLRLTMYCAAGDVDRLVQELHRVLRESD